MLRRRSAAVRGISPIGSNLQYPALLTLLHRTLALASPVLRRGSALLEVGPLREREPQRSRHKEGSRPLPSFPTIPARARTVAQGSALTRYRRAIERRHIFGAEIAAKEMAYLSLRDALGLRTPRRTHRSTTARQCGGLVGSPSKETICW